MMDRSRSSFASRRSQGDPAEITRLNPRNMVQGSVERTIAWLNRCRRLAKDWECLNRKALAFLHLASIRLMLRKLSHTTISHNKMIPDRLLEAVSTSTFGCADLTLWKVAVLPLSGFSREG